MEQRAQHGAARGFSHASQWDIAACDAALWPCTNQDAGARGLSRTTHTELPRECALALWQNSQTRLRASLRSLDLRFPAYVDGPRTQLWSRLCARCALER